MVDRVQMNARKPECDEYGDAVLTRMNKKHNELSLWGLSHIDISDARDILDIGCGGGMNISNMLSAAKQARLYGIDYSEASVAKTKEINAEAVSGGRAFVICGKAEELPYEAESFDFVTAFETVYYWHEPVSCFRKIRDILRAGGELLICNEDCDNVGIEEASAALGMTLFTDAELVLLLKEAGFCEVRGFAHENGRWVCAVGRKPV